MKKRFALVLYLSVLGFVALMAYSASSTGRVQAQIIVTQLPEGAEPLPPGVSIETVLTGMDKPVAMAFDPQGRLFYTEKDAGNVRLFANGALQAGPVITFRVDNNNERGLLGIAIDPAFNENHYIYIYYTCAVGNGCPSSANRVVRFVESNGVGSNPIVIFTSPATAAESQHNGGNIHFGPDGKLYISIGDDANPANSQDVTVKNGKMHRINPDGSIPADNPDFHRAGAVPSLYAMGLRNSFDFTFDPVVPGRIFATENGRECDDEVNRIEAAFNYGWRPGYLCDDQQQGLDPQYNTIPPLWTSGQGAHGRKVPTGITVYTGNQIPQWRNDLFMSTYQDPLNLYHFTLNADRTTLVTVKVVPDVFANMDIETGPDGALWYIEGGGFQGGTLKRLVASKNTVTPTPQPPVAVTPSVTPNPPSIPGNGSRAFPETGKSVTGIFLDYWNAHGGLPQQGYPISDLITEVSDLNGKPYAVQYFERAVFEYHPENQPPYNVLLSQLGTFQYRKKYPAGAPNQQPYNSAGSVLFPETGHRVGGKFLEYWRKNGGLAQQGYPISEEFIETSDLNGKEYRVQYFERSVFEEHPENQSPYDVLLSQLGTLRHKAKYEQLSP